MVIRFNPTDDFFFYGQIFMDPSQTMVKWFCPAVEPSYNVCSITRVKSRKYRTASFRNKLTSQCKHSNHTTNKAGNLQTTTEIEPGDNIIYQPDAITSWSDGSVLQWAQSFWSHVISVQPKSMSLLLLILVVKWRNKKKKHPSAGDGSPARPA